MELERAKRAVLQKLQSLERAGVEQIGRLPFVEPKPIPQTTVEVKPVADNRGSTNTPKAEKAERVQPTKQPAKSIREERPKTATQPVNVGGTLLAEQPGTLEERQVALQVLQKEVAGCMRCEQLASTRRQTVFGTGNPEARLCFFGEAPGADEDRLGQPFVGAAGQLLDKIIAAMTLRREDVYILNVLKCRPPGNRNPQSDEIANCRNYFETQLQIIQPEFICCLGSFAAQTLLRTTQSVGRLRKKFHDYKGIQVVATYHPAYLLRTPSAKKDTWNDMKMLMEAMGLEVP